MVLFVIHFSLKGKILGKPQEVTPWKDIGLYRIAVSKKICLIRRILSVTASIDRLRGSVQVQHPASFGPSSVVERPGCYPASSVLPSVLSTVKRSVVCNVLRLVQTSDSESCPISSVLSSIVLNSKLSIQAYRYPRAVDIFACIEYMIISRD